MRVLLFSGGIESTCLAAMQRPDVALTVDYGQVCAIGETKAAANIAQILGLRHEVVRAPLGHLGSGDLAGAPPNIDCKIPEHWPFRNQMLITVAAMRFAGEGSCELVIGTVSSDRVHSDGTEAFVTAMREVLRSQAPDVELLAPALKLTTLELVTQSGVSRDLLGWTFSCHRSSVACGACRGCNKTHELFNVLKCREEIVARVG